MDAVIFTDGACKGNPGPGGWAAIVVWDGQVQELGGSFLHTTNNQMELRAAIEALEFARTRNLEHAEIYSDSSYVINGITKWVHAWKKNGWKTQDKKEVQNMELWQELCRLVYELKMEISWKYVGGHVGIAGNERADEIATTFAEGEVVQLYGGPLSQYGVNVSNLNHNEKLHAAKSQSRSRSKQAAFSYVSKVDGIIQTHKTWAECEARVKGKTARYKKALSAEDEKKIIREFKSS